MHAAELDVIVVGSGFGGAVCALRAAEAGLRVLVLERGQRLAPDVYESMAQGKAPIFLSQNEPGPLELHRLRGLLALTANAVGGGSNIYTAVTLRPPPEVFATRWPADVNDHTLAPCFERVEKMISPTRIPGSLQRVSALEAIARRMGAAATRLPLSMTWPEDPTALAQSPETEGVYRELTTWLRGGRVASKRTLSDTYLQQAEALGVRIRPLHEVVSIAPHAGGYRLDYRCRQDDGWAEGTVEAPRVVIATGALNTTRLLLKCRDVLGTLPDLSAALGTRFFTNGDFGGLLVAPDTEPAADSGPPVTAWIDLWQRDRIYLMETGMVPFDFGSFTGLLNPARWFGAMRLAPVKRTTWSFGTMGYQDHPGRLILGRRGALIHRHNFAETAPFHARTLAVLRELADVAGAKLIVPPEVVVKRLPITVHPLGGAVMADTPRCGVTDSRGEVFGYRGLTIADGSLIPAPTAVPPSMTIAALAERVAEHLVRQ